MLNGMSMLFSNESGLRSGDDAFELVGRLDSSLACRVEEGYLLLRRVILLIWLLVVEIARVHLGVLLNRDHLLLLRVLLHHLRCPRLLHDWLDMQVDYAWSAGLLRECLDPEGRRLLLDLRIERLSALRLVRGHWLRDPNRAAI